MEIVLNRITIYTLSKLEATTNEDPTKKKPERPAVPLPCGLSILVHTDTHC